MAGERGNRKLPERPALCPLCPLPKRMGDAIRLNP